MTRFKVGDMVRLVTRDHFNGRVGIVSHVFDNGIGGYYIHIQGHDMPWFYFSPSELAVTTDPVATNRHMNVPDDGED